MALSCLGMLFSSVAAFFCCRVTSIVEARRNAFSPREYMTKVVPGESLCLVSLFDLVFWSGERKWEEVSTKKKKEKERKKQRSRSFSLSLLSRNLKKKKKKKKVGLLMALTLHFGNVVYLHLTVSFIQMLKAFTPVVTMAALFAAGLEKPRRDLVGAVAAIAGGTALASAGEVNLSYVGVACMAASEAFEAARLVLTQTLLGANGPRSLGPVEGLLYLAPACSAWLLLGSAVMELPAMRREGAWGVVMVRA